MTKPSSARSSAKRARPGFHCTECGAIAVQWVGRCSECQAWGTVVEIGAPVTAPTTRNPVSTPAQAIDQLDPELARHRATGVDELDRVLGGGIVPGSVVLLAGEPGVGKSTLLLEVARQYAEHAGQPALIVTGEESTSQVRLRAERTGALHPQLFLAAENDLGALLSHVDAVEPGLLVVDSVQTISTTSIDAAVGAVSQIRAVAAGLIAVAKSKGMVCIIVGHVTKDGAIAGPRVLEHLVDVVLHFEGDRASALRLIRATKNRFGAADEVGCFEMQEGGIVGLADPSRLFLHERESAVAGSCVCAIIEGRRPMVVELQALLQESFGAPRRVVTNLDSSRTAMIAAVLERAGSEGLGRRDLYASTVGGIRAMEPAADLAIAIALFSALHNLPVPPTLCAFGEVSLAGDVRRVHGIERRLAEAARLGFNTALVPVGHVDDVVAPRSIAGITTHPVSNIVEALRVLRRLAEAAPKPRRVALVPGPDDKPNHPVLNAAQAALGRIS